MAVTSVSETRPPADAGAFLPRQDRHKPKGGPPRASKSGRRRAWVLIGVHVLIGLHFLHWGLTGESVTPVEPSEAMQTVELGRINAGFLLFTALILTTLVFGRWFCGWACHVVALQDLCAWLLKKVGLKPRPVRSRLLVLAPWAVAYYMFVHPIVLHWWDPVQKPMPGVSDWELHLTSTDLWATFPGWIMAPVTLLVVGFLIVWWLGAKGFCTHGCPYGAFFATADRFSPMRIRVTDACEKCGHCTATCSSNVRVHEEVAKYGKVVDPGCMKCMDCVSVCPKGALYYGAGAPKPFTLSQQRVKARADFSWPEEVALAVVAFVAAQWTFRGAWFGEGVPLLLAVGLGVITAVFAVMLVRLLRRSAVEFQHTALKRNGRFTRAGVVALVLIGGWLVFSVHTFTAQRFKESAAAIAEPPLRERLGERKQVSEARFVEAHEAVDRALAIDLVDDPMLLQMRGLLRRELSRHADAEVDLRATWEAVRSARAGTALAIYRLRAGDLDEAERIAREVLEASPEDATAKAILEQVEQRR